MKIEKKRRVKFRFKLIILACFLIYIGIAIYTQQTNIDGLMNQKEALTQQYTDKQTELSRLEHQSEYMNTDNYIENTAREKFGFAYGGEIILEPNQ